MSDLRGGGLSYLSSGGLRDLRGGLSDMSGVGFGFHGVSNLISAKSVSWA